MHYSYFTLYMGCFLFSQYSHFSIWFFNIGFFNIDNWALKNNTQQWFSQVIIINNNNNT